ncbi:MAG: hypothetical protein ACK41E_10255 [Deinococcales bacterium]
MSHKLIQEIIAQLNKPPYKVALHGSHIDENTVPIEIITPIETNEIHKLTRHALGNRLYLVEHDKNNFLVVLCQRIEEVKVGDIIRENKQQTTVYLFWLGSEQFIFVGSFLQMVFRAMSPTGRFASIKPSNISAKANELYKNSFLPIIASVLECDADGINYEPYNNIQIPSKAGDSVHGSFASLEDFLEYYKTRADSCLYYENVTGANPEQVISPFTIDPSPFTIDPTVYEIEIPKQRNTENKTSPRTIYGPLVSFESFTLKTPFGNRVYQLEATDHLGVRRRWLAILSQENNRRESLRLGIAVIEVNHVYEKIVVYGHVPFSDDNFLRHGVIPHTEEIIDQDLAEAIIQKVLMLDAQAYAPNLRWAN